eukprot:jgi/Botrbrau1/23169/Bobra.0041s0020.1
MESPKSTQQLTWNVATVPKFGRNIVGIADFVRDLDGRETTVFAASAGKCMGTESNGLFDAIVSAYRNNQHLHLTPDDVWLAIAQGFGHHLSYGDNTEKYRKKIVTDEVKRPTIDPAEPVSPDNIDWTAWVKILSGEVCTGVVAAVDKIIQADFSTSTQVTVTASRMVLLENPMRQVFQFSLDMHHAIPEVTLHGTLEDWLRVQEKASALRALDVGLDLWLDALDPILQELINTYQGKVNEQFWSLVINKSQHFGSGSGKPDTINGWITRFFPYGKYKQIRTDLTEPMTHETVPEGRVACPFELGETAQQPTVSWWQDFLERKRMRMEGSGPRLDGLSVLNLPPRPHPIG